MPCYYNLAQSTTAFPAGLIEAVHDFGVGTPPLCLIAHRVCGEDVLANISGAPCRLSFHHGLPLGSLSYQPPSGNTRSRAFGSDGYDNAQPAGADPTPYFCVLGSIVCQSAIIFGTRYSPFRTEVDDHVVAGAHTGAFSHYASVNEDKFVPTRRISRRTTKRGYFHTFGNTINIRASNPMPQFYNDIYWTDYTQWRYPVSGWNHQLFATSTASHTITGLARIQVTQTKTITGKARIQAAAVQHTITGKARIQATNSTHTITGKARIQNTTSHTIPGKARIQVTNSTHTITGKARIQATQTKTITGKARIQTSAVQHTITGKARIQTTQTKTITGKARIQSAAVQHTITGKARIQATQTKTITGKARIQTSAVQHTITGKARIQTTQTKTITGKARIQSAAVQHTITGKARIQATQTKTITGKARIQTSAVQHTLTGLARIQTTQTKTISGVARIREAEDRLIPGVARIQNTISFTLSGKATIKVSPKVLISGLARIQVPRTRILFAKARIMRKPPPPPLPTISGKAFILGAGRVNVCLPSGSAIQPGTPDAGCINQSKGGSTPLWSNPTPERGCDLPRGGEDNVKKAAKVNKYKLRVKNPDGSHFLPGS